MTQFQFSPVRGGIFLCAALSLTACDYVETQLPQTTDVAVREVQVRGRMYTVIQRTDENIVDDPGFEYVDVNNSVVLCSPDCVTAVRRELVRQEDSGGEY